MRRSGNTSSFSRGFTLVELLLAITLMSMLLALAYGGLRASTRATDRGQVILEESGRIRMAHQFVRKQINQMLPLVFVESDVPEERAVFEGAGHVIRFVSPMPGYLSFGGPQVQELAIVQGDQGLALVLSHALLQEFEEEKLYERDPIFLLDRIERATFHFLGLDDDGNLTTWTSDWARPDTLPLAVSLDIEFEEDVYTTWPMLTAAVRIDSTALKNLAGMQGMKSERGPAITDLIRKRREQN